MSANEAVPGGFLVPMVATLNTSSGITAARAEAALAFEQPFSVGGGDVEIARIAATGMLQTRIQSVFGPRHQNPP